MPPVYGRVGGMEKTTVYLSSEQKAALAHAAQEQGRSEARLIRDGIDAVTTGQRAAETLTPYASATPDWERPRWIARDTLVAILAQAHADAGLGGELRALAPDTTDDEPLP